MIKIIIANNNDILYNSLSEIALKTKEKIEIINVPIDKINSLFCQIIAKENLIILDSITSVTFCTNILKNAINRIGKRNIVILVIDSNVINAEIKHQLFKKKSINFPIWDIVGLVSDSLKESLEIERNIDTILWRMGFTSCKAKGYLKDAILLAYTDKTLLLDTQNLIKKVAEKNNIENDIYNTGNDKKDHRAARISDCPEYCTAKIIYHHRRHAQEQDSQVNSCKTYHLVRCLHQYQNFSCTKYTDYSQKQSAYQTQRHGSMYSFS